jgi:hypothetical protein
MWLRGLKEVRVVRSPLRVVVEGHEGPVPRRARDYGLARNDSTPCGCVDLKEVRAVRSPLRVVLEGHGGLQYPAEPDILVWPGMSLLRVEIILLLMFTLIGVIKLFTTDE